MPFPPKPRQALVDFHSAMGEEFGNAVSPPVPYDEAAPNECCEAIALALGDEVTPDRLAALSAADLDRLAAAFAEWFECEAPSVAQMELAVARTLVRWPAGSLDDGD